MSCLSRSPQAVRPITSRMDQVNRVVSRQTSNNQTFTVCISFFFFIVTLLFLKKLFMGKYMELCILCFLGVENDIVKTDHS
jgi:hypothetical protein